MASEILVITMPWPYKIGEGYTEFTLSICPSVCRWHGVCLNSSLHGQNGCHFDRWHFKCIFLNENYRIPIEISLKRSPIDNKPALDQVMAWRRTGDKLLPELMLTQFIYVALGGDELMIDQHWPAQVVALWSFFNLYPLQERRFVEEMGNSLFYTSEVPSNLWYKIPNLKTEMFLISSCSCLCPVHWTHVLSP